MDHIYLNCQSILSIVRIWLADHVGVGSAILSLLILYLHNGILQEGSCGDMTNSNSLW